MDDAVSVSSLVEQSAVETSAFLEQIDNQGSDDLERKPERRGSSYVWKYCEKISRHMIRCNLCVKVMSFHGTANVITHLQRKHNINGKMKNEGQLLSHLDLSADDVKMQQVDDFNDCRPYKRNSANASIVWKYCTRIDRDVVRCGICKRNLSYQGTSNLQRHLHRMHGITSQITNRTLYSNNMQQSWKQIDSEIVWQHCSFVEEETGEEKIKCKLCEPGFLGQDLNEISRHLQAIHNITAGSKPTTIKKKRRRVQSDTTSTTDDDNQLLSDFWNKSETNNEDELFKSAENELKREETLFNDIIEEMPVTNHEDEKPFIENKLPGSITNPLSPHMSRASSTDGLPDEKQKQFHSAHMIKLNEEKLRMETEYFRQKAGYYRMQKYLTALQARKVRLELDQLTNGTMVCVGEYNSLDTTTGT